MNTKQILDELARQTKNDTSNLRANGLAWANMGYLRVANDMDYPHLRRMATFSTVAGTRLYIPTPHAMRLLSVRNSAKNRYLLKTNFERIERGDPDYDSVTTTGEPMVWAMAYWRASLVDVAPAGIKPFIVSSATADSATTVCTIEGIVGGEIDRETLAITGTGSTGTTAVQCTKTYTEFLGFSKNQATVGTITLQNLGTNPTITYSTLSPLAKTKRYLQVLLQPTPDAVYSLTAKFLPWLPDLVNDSDIPLIPEEDHEIIIKAALTYAGVFQANAQMQAEAERAYLQALGRIRGRMKAGGDEVPAWTFGGGGVIGHGSIPPYSDYLNGLYR